MKEQVSDLKKNFDARCQEFKKQVEEFKQNNEAIEALKKAHAGEIANHVQSHNSKYNSLLTEKLNSEDALRAEAEKMKNALIKEW
jgi:chromosome segregation ATPase